MRRQSSKKLHPILMTALSISLRHTARAVLFVLGKLKPPPYP